MSVRANVLVRSGAVLALLLLGPVRSAAGVRVDEPGPPRPPRVPLPADYRRSSSLQFEYGASGISALGFAGDGSIGMLTFERARSPKSSWILRVSSTRAEELMDTQPRLDILRDGRIEGIRTARVDAVEIGLRTSSHGANAFYAEFDAGLARTRLDGVIIDSSNPVSDFRTENRRSTQMLAGTTLGHVWQPVRFPVGLLVELGWRTRFGAPQGSDVSARIGLLGQRPASAE